MYDLFTQPPLQGELLRDAGIQTALAHAQEFSSDWNRRCFSLLLRFVQIRSEFTCEQFREWARIEIEQPPSLRAFGGIINRAAKAGLIQQVGTVKVTNPKAHRANAALWKRK
jgi:hypothetical protein